MDISLTTPALLFPAISLLLLAYTNRFLAIASLIRDLHAKYKKDRDKMLYGQIKNLKLRLILIRNMQALGISSLFICVLCMFLLYAGLLLIGQIVFGISLVLLMISLALSVWEIQISVNALNIQLGDLSDIKPE
ncbi:DUF2721 domain-containing protein [Chondrinema litorale]|uniref:DUF2721 domain-containing protein n=1 Tax=Chondrinema litorale TaxID=2994555 RepID=UPI0025436A85|nr:DUF2721 domain-containing protein [Chondrinema litorale]UZR93981.1 DUF2721 domain-containing protein [Chondrinema litorale]